MTGLLSVSEARRKLLESFAPVSTVRLPLEQASGRVLAKAITAGLDIPPFDNSSMDGFAVRSADLKPANANNPVVLRVTADAPAGEASAPPVGPGEAIRIMTGAPVPAGADAVIPVEETDFNYRQPGLPAPEQVKIFKGLKAGDNVRPRGQDLHAGEPVLPACLRLRPQDLGFLAMLGIPEVPVYRKPRVALFSSGDELLPAGASLQPGKIHDSNSYTLGALVRRYGADVLHLGIIPDRAEAVEAALNRAATEKVDLILTSAGVSVGAFDFVRAVVESHGQLSFWRVNMRPGKPLAFGAYQDIPFIGLPGNPVSAYVGFEVFVRPALLKLGGAVEFERPRIRVRLLEPIESDGRESYLRAVVRYQDGAWTARLTGHQGSGNLRSLVQANALLIVSSGVKSLPIGADTEAWIMDEPLLEAAG